MVKLYTCKDLKKYTTSIYVKLKLTLHKPNSLPSQKYKIISFKKKLYLWTIDCHKSNNKKQNQIIVQFEKSSFKSRFIMK